ncbi:hypothetical protein HOLleu_34563 [Holothuria leucospilota]|uniref:Reverse transcriptase domain-containing protein n=1 Tax=Holothuria leucospilota TaxID=206669 RepID=A0A9Q0YSA4_HOLLE|nr:hypothetical protein HOLleu_34563 [Holothuria leucospilota]
MADIEGMFHQVCVPQADSNALRFLWWKDANMSSTLHEYQMQVHLFGATWSPSCAGYALQKTVEDNYQDFDADVGQTVISIFYVDDCLRSVPTIDEGRRLIPQLSELLRRGGFRLTKWFSNNKDVMSVIPPSERAESVVDLDLDHLPIEKILGMWWDMDVDNFSFKMSTRDVPLTRRGLLCAMRTLYDPLGLSPPMF